MKIMGLDLSMTGTGCVVMEDSDIIYQKLISTKLIKGESGKAVEQDDLRRIIEIKDQIEDVMNITHFLHNDLDKTRIAIEGPALGVQGKTQSIVTLGKLLGIIEHWLATSLNIKYAIIPPTSLKKAILGKGIGKKELMLKEVWKKYKIDFTDNNLCDAFCLCTMILPPEIDKKTLKISNLPLITRKK